MFWMPSPAECRNHLTHNGFLTGVTAALLWRINSFTAHLCLQFVKHILKFTVWMLFGYYSCIWWLKTSCALIWFCVIGYGWLLIWALADLQQQRILQCIFFNCPILGFSMSLTQPKYRNPLFAECSEQENYLIFNLISLNHRSTLLCACYFWTVLLRFWPTTKSSIEKYHSYIVKNQTTNRFSRRNDTQ